MKNFLNSFATPITMLATGVAIFVLAEMYFKGAAVLYGPDAEDILAPLFYDISRSIHDYGLLAGMYDPGQFAGLSLWSTPYFHPLYPFYFNWLGTDTSIFDTADRLRLVVFIHLAIYGVGNYLLSREIGVRHWVAVAIGLSSPWLPGMQSTLPWPQILASFAWLPWVVACQVRLYKKPSGYRRAAAILGLAVAFSLLVYAQPAQNMVLVVVGSALIWAYMAVPAVVRSRKADFRPVFEMTLSLLAASLLAILLCGEYLLGVVRFLDGAIRWVGASGVIIGSQRIPLDALKVYALRYSDVSDAVNYHQSSSGGVGNFYIGAIPAIGVVVGLFIKWRDQTIGALLFSAAVTVLFCLYIFTPILQFIPIANKVREVNWWSCYAVVIALPIGGYGLQLLLDSLGTGFDRSRVRRAPLWIAVGGCVLAAVLIATSRSEAGPFELLVLGLGFGLLMSCAVRPIPTRPFHQPLIMAIVAMSAMVPVLSHGKLSPQGVLLLNADHVEARKLAKEIASNIADGDEFRFGVSPDLPIYESLTVNLSNLGLRGIRGDVTPQPYDKFRLLFFPTPAVSGLYGVKYLIVPGAAHVPGDVPIDRTISLHVNQHVLPRLFFVQGGLTVVPSPVDALLNVSDDGGWHFFVRPGDLPAGLDGSIYSVNPASVHFMDVSTNKTANSKASFSSDGSGLLVLNEDPEGRWQGKIDGRNVKSFRINGFQTAFPVIGTGRHAIEITRPASLF